MEKPTRFSFLISKRFNDLLEEISEAESVTKVEAIRRSVAVYLYLCKELSDEGTKLQIISPDNGVVRELVLASALSGAYRQPSRRKKVTSKAVLVASVPEDVQIGMLAEAQ